MLARQTIKRGIDTTGTEFLARADFFTTIPPLAVTAVEDTLWALFGVPDVFDFFAGFGG
jgi:hypothetical protein